jgi:predicted DCC family thiol-disulfide oxidoreductase YuxK/uncharacterized membrane protein YphA (DoxX/SURF4 family)
VPTDSTDAPHVGVTGHPPKDRPLFVFDGDCGFCKRWVERWRANARGTVDFRPFQEVASDYPDIPLEQFRTAAQLVEADGTVRSGAAGVFAMLGRSGSRVLPMLYARFEGFATAADFAYGLVARRRVFASRVTRLFLGTDLRRPTFFLSRWLFLRLLGVVALAAFVSFGRQADGLIGPRGIDPASEFLERMHLIARQRGWSESALHHAVPTLQWLAPTASVTSLVIVGVLASIALILDLVPALAVAVIWACYLSLATLGSVFMHYQWDALLLETCVVALFLAPWRIRPRIVTDRPPTAAGLWLVRLLVFKLMFLSGIVKRVSGDPTWKSLTALQYHYWTQPLPLWTSWYANRLPASAQAACTWMVLAIELYVPLLIFIPRTPRYVAFAAFLLLQVAIATTGNYGFFNALTVVLAIVLLDDSVLARAMPRSVRLSPTHDAPRSSPRTRSGDARGILASVSLTLAAATIATLSASRIAGTIDPSIEAPAPVAALSEWMAPFDSMNSYGLFAVMTTERREIEVEGSVDGVSWRPYLFRWKPSPDVTASPRFDFMDMPRLDWQMWFASLSGRCDRAPWYLAFLRRLLEGSPEVLALLAGNPFPEGPPRFIRSRQFDARFTTAEEHAATGAWWKRSEIGTFCPAVTLKDGRLSAAAE